MKKCVRLLTILLFVTSLVASYAFAHDVQPGVDLFETPPGTGSTSIKLDIEVGFFGPGSDAVTDTVELRGKSLGQGWEFCQQEDLYMNLLGKTCTIVERLETAILPDTCNSHDTIQIKIVALRLVSVAPIEVTYFGGLYPEKWNVQVSLSSTEEQLEGEMTIYHEYEKGGVYEAELPVIPRLTFTRVTDLEQVVLDPGPLEYMNTPPIPPAPAPAEACWSHCAEFPIVRSDGNIKVDHDGNPETPCVPVGPSSDFVPGGCGFTATGDRPTCGPALPGASAVTYRKVLSREEAVYANHGIQPANPLDHFKVYDVDTISVVQSVTLYDQFDPAGAVDSVALLEIDCFAVPVDKNFEGIADPNAHLIWYRFVSPDPTMYWVEVENQLIRQGLIIGPAEYLLVAAEKIEPGSEFPVNLDHYECYPVISGQNYDKYVTMWDQFSGEYMKVTKPVFFCNPVDKNSEGIISDIDHLVFYKIDTSTVFDPPIEATAMDQFDTYSISVDSSLFLGVPSNKLRWGVWNPDAAVQLSSFDAAKHDDHVEVVWTTASEISNGGFNIHRSPNEDGPYARINSELIPAKGNELEGASYFFVDRDVADSFDYYYWLESIDLSGEGTMHGPVFVTAAEESPIPVAFRLAQNHPNPFNPVTEIRYDLPVDCHVNLEVYDVLGRKVATLVDKNQKAGSKVIHWNVSSDFSSGVYFYRLHAGSFIEAKKMVILK